MRMDMIRFVSAAGLASLGLAGVTGCASEDPEIWDLEHENTTFTVGDTDSLSGTVEFLAEYGELEYLLIDIEPPRPDDDDDDHTIELPPSELESAEDEQRGTLEWRFFFQPEFEGDHDFELYVIDENGNESNRLQDTFRVQRSSGARGDFRAEPVILEAEVRGAH